MEVQEAGAINRGTPIYVPIYIAAKNPIKACVCQTFRVKANMSLKDPPSGMGDHFRENHHLGPFNYSPFFPSVVIWNSVIPRA